MRCALLHGFAGDHSAWQEVIAAWQLEKPPFAINLPGHGSNPVLDTWDENLRAIAKQIDSCDCVVGYSLGARVALGLVAEGYLPRGVLIGVNPGIADEERASRRNFDAAWSRLLRTQGLIVFAEAWEAQPLFATQARAPEARVEARRRRRLRHDPEQLARSLEVMGLATMPDYRPAMAVHRDRLALIAGADDTKYAGLGLSLPAASFETIPDSGHDPTLERPAALAGAIARAVKRIT